MYLILLISISSLAQLISSDLHGTSPFKKKTFVDITCTFVDTNPHNDMRIDQWICLVIIFAKVVLRAETAVEINNKKANTFAFQFLTSARFSEQNRVALILISLLSRDGVDSIISKVCSGSAWSILYWLSPLSWMAKSVDVQWNTGPSCKISLFLRKK